jgi:probable non-F420 flavinoid oxidoreductase
MAIIGYHASHEQFKPSELLKWTVMAERAGFQAVNCSDHFHPWSKRQGQSGFSFSWLGASMQATSVPHGVVCAPGQRYHPAIVAQAAATLSEMFPGRFWISVGSGEALNERITGGKWPAKQPRNERLREAVDIMRRLLAGETVSHHGLITVEEAKLYTRPLIAPLIIGAAVTTETAEWVGEWADGLITISKPAPELKEIVKAFKKKGGGKPMYLKVQLSFSETYDRALEGAHDQWRTNIFSGSVLGDLWKVEHFDALGEMVQPDEMKNKVLISADTRQFKQWIEEFIDMGFEKIILHNVNREQEHFIREFGANVLPHFKKDLVERE